jgi:NADPH:quinone reductase-like Zn-dependent oxidoreductase
MRKLELTAFGEPADVVALKTVPEPALGDDDVLVAMEAASINPSDFLLIRALYGFRPALPFSLGAEGVGRIVKTGAKVDASLRAKRVLIVPNLEQGTWAEQVAVPVHNVVPVSDTADPLQLAMVGINAATAWLLLEKYVRLMPGDWIGLTAANSAMGETLVRLAGLAGVKTLAIIRRKDVAEQVMTFGGDLVVLQSEHLHDDVEAALGGKQLALVVDMVGGTVGGELARSLKPGGAIVSYALLSGRFPILAPGDFLYRGLSFHGFWMMNWVRSAPRTEIQEVYQRLGDLVATGSLRASVDHTYPLDRFKDAFAESLKPNRGGKVLFKFGAA